MKNGNKLIVLFSMLLLVLSFMSTAVVAEDVAVWTEWIVNGQGVPTYTMDAEKGETVNFYVYAESFHSFELDIYLEDQNNNEISNFNDDPVDGYTNFFKEYSYVASQVGTFYIHPVAKIGSFVNEDEIKLVVTCQDTDADGV